METTGSLGLNASLQTSTNGRKTRSRRVYNFGIPGIGRLAFSRDPGEANLFAERFLRTNLSARIINPYGELVEEHDLGSGKVTNIGVLALASDYVWPSGGITKSSKVNVFNACKFHAWGTSGTAVKTTDFELGAYAKPTAAAENAVEGTNTLVFETLGKNQTMRATAKIKAAEELKIEEWGLHSSAALKPATQEGGAGAPTSTSFFAKAASLTASTEEVRGATNNVMWVEESAGVSHAVIGLITKNTTGEVTVPGWIKAGTEEKGENPKEKAKYRIIPTLFDHRTFGIVTVENLDEIEFVWNLEIVAGG